MRKEFKQRGRYNQVEKKIPSKVLGEIWRKVYDNNPQLEALLLEAKTKAGTNKPLNQYWNEAIAGTTLEDEYSKEELFEEAAEDLGIDLDQYTEERKFIEYDFNIPPFKQSTTARNNMILELSRKRLEDYETFEERLTPGGFRNPSRAARLMRELFYKDNSSFIDGNKLNLSEVRKNAENTEDPEPEYDPSNPMTIITYNKQNQIASKLIGIFANHNTHHAFISSLAECKFDLKTGSIAFGNHPEGLYDLLHAPNGADTFLSMAEYLASSVDAVKDPVLNFLNLNTLTADSGALLSRLGYSFEEIGLLFNQPIIKELCEYCVDNNITDITNGINEIVLRHKEIVGFDKLAVNPYTLNVERLAYNIAVKPEKVEQTVQAQALKLFAQISNQAKDLSQFILNSKFTASNSVSSTFGDAYEKMDRLMNYLKGKENSSLIIKVNDFNDPELSTLAEEYGLGSSEYLQVLMRNPMAFEQVMSDCNLEALVFFNKLVPYGNNTYSMIRSILSSFTRNEYLNGEVIDNIFKDIPFYMLQNDGNSLLNPNKFHHDTITNKEYYLNEFPKELYNFLSNRKDLQSYNLFKYLSPNFETDKEGNQKFYISPQDTGGISIDTVNLIRQEWTRLYNNKDTRWIVEGIFNYSFYTVGFNFNHNSFINLVSTEFKLDYVVATDYDGNPITYVEYFKNILDNKHDVDSLKFADLFVRNHPNESSLIYSPKGKALSIIEGLLKLSDNSTANEFTISKENMGKLLTSFILKVDSDKMFHFRPYIKIGDSLYRAVGNSPYQSFNASPIKSITYQKVSILGDTINSINYFENDNFVGRTPEIKSGKDSFESSSDGESKILTDEILDSLFIEALKRSKNQLIAFLADPNNPNYISDANRREIVAEESINEYISKIGNYNRENKIDTIKAQAKELLKGFVDGEGNPIC